MAAGDAYLTRRLRPFTTTIFATMSELASATGSVNLGQGFPDTDGPDELREVAVAAIREGRNQYPPSAGIPELRRAVAEHQRAWYGIDLDPETEVLVTVGATEAIAATLLALCEPGDEVVMFEPSYDSYAACAAMAGAVPRLVRLHPPDWSFDPDELAAAAGPRARIMLLNSPHNPTGKVFSSDELAQVAALCTAHDLLAVTDEVYEHLVFDGTHVPLATLPGMRDRTVTISSGGKTFSFTGWKVGWVGAAPPLVAAVRAAKQFLTYTSPAAFQLAIAHGLGYPPPLLQGFAAELAAKRDLLCDGLEGAGLRGVPSGRDLLRHDGHRSGGTGQERPGLLSRPARALRGRRHPVLGLLRSGRPRSRADAGALGLLQARSGAARRPDPLSIVGTMSIPITWVDAFSDTAFGGNPAAVCLLAEPLDEARMQSIAFELGISETAFLTHSDDPTTFGLRWFSPATEIDLCGHATLASAHALREGGTVDGAVPLTFHTRSGPLHAAFEGDRIALDFPADPMTPGPVPEPLKEQWPAASWPAGTPPSSPSSPSPRPRRCAPTSRTWTPSPPPAPGRSCSPRRPIPGRGPTTCCGSSGPMWGSTRTRPPVLPSARPARTGQVS